MPEITMPGLDMPINRPGDPFGEFFFKRVRFAAGFQPT
jgi:hypothetical protein